MKRRRCQLLLLPVLLAVCACTPDGEQPKRAPNLPPATSGGTRLLAQVELIRNGGFTSGSAHFALGGPGLGPHTDAGRLGDGRDQGLQFDVSANLAPTQVAVQDLMLPDALDAARFRVAYRVGGTARSRLQRLDIGIGVLGPTDVVPSVVFVHHDMQHVPASGWQQVDLRLTAEQRADLAALRRRKQRAVLWLRLVGDGVRVHVDDLSFVVDGRRTLPALTGRITYAVKPPHQPYRLETVTPDGRARVTHWAAPHAGANAKGIDWSPDGQTLIFSSDHDMAWSPFTADMYALAGGALHKLTNGPATPVSKTARPGTGQVDVVVKNLHRHQVGPLAICIRGARLAGSITLGPLEERAVTLIDVPDLGAEPQLVWARMGGRTTWAALPVDVRASQTVKAPGVLSIGQLTDHQVTEPSVHHAGRYMAVAIGGLHTLSLQGGVPSEAHIGHLFGFSPRYAPKDDRLLYAGMGGIYVLLPGAASARQVVGGARVTGLVQSPRWMPDGESLLYLASVRHPLLGAWSVQIHAVDLQGGAARARTALLGADASHPAPSPDGRFIAYRRSARGDPLGTLWVMPLDDPGGAWQVAVNGDPAHLVWRP